MYDVRIRYGDGRRSIVENHIDDLGEACSFVLKLADELGGAGDDDDDTAKWVEVYRYDRLEISVSVVRGGLGDRRLSPTLRSSG